MGQIRIEKIIYFVNIIHLLTLIITFAEQDINLKNNK